MLHYYWCRRKYKYLSNQTICCSRFHYSQIKTSLNCKIFLKCKVPCFSICLMKINLLVAISYTTIFAINSELEFPCFSICLMKINCLLLLAIQLFLLSILSSNYFSFEKKKSSRLSYMKQININLLSLFVFKRCIPKCVKLCDPLLEQPT